MIRIRPEAIVDLHARLPPAEIVSAALLGDTTAYFHDRRTQAEGEGLWTPGSSTIDVDDLLRPRQRAGAGAAGGASTHEDRTRRSAVGWREQITPAPNGERRHAAAGNRTKTRCVDRDEQVHFSVADRSRQLITVRLA